MNKSLFLISLILISITAACSTKPPPDLIPKDTFIKVMVDLELNRAYFQAARDSVKADSIRQLLLHKYNVTDQQYVATREYYQRTGQEHDIIKKALDQLNHEKDKVYGYIRQKTDTTHKDQKKASVDTTGRFGKHPDHPPHQ